MVVVVVVAKVVLVAVIVVVVAVAVAVVAAVVPIFCNALTPNMCTQLSLKLRRRSCMHPAHAYKSKTASTLSHSTCARI